MITPCKNPSACWHFFFFFNWKEHTFSSHCEDPKTHPPNLLKWMEDFLVCVGGNFCDSSPYPHFTLTHKRSAPNKKEEESYCIPCNARQSDFIPCKLSNKISSKTSFGFHCNRKDLTTLCGS